MRTPTQLHLKNRPCYPMSLTVNQAQRNNNEWKSRMRLKRKRLCLRRDKKRFCAAIMFVNQALTMRSRKASRIGKSDEHCFQFLTRRFYLRRFYCHFMKTIWSFSMIFITYFGNECLFMSERISKLDNNHSTYVCYCKDYWNI